MRYTKGKGYLVGTFSETDLLCGRDKLEVKKVQEELGLQFTNTEVVTKRGVAVGMKIYVCDAEDMRL